jgi:hypothetical protein
MKAVTTMTTTMSSRFFCALRTVIPVLVFLASYEGMTQNKATNLKDARDAVEANMRTAEGKKFDEQLGNDFAQHHMGPLHQCKQNGAPLENSWMLLKLDKDGVPREILLYPETKMGVCARDGFFKEKFLAPPRADYWVSAYLKLAK